MLEIMQKNNVLCRLNEKNGVVEINRLPLDLYLSEETGADAQANNLVNFYAWCATRLIDKNRTNSAAILGSYGLVRGNTDKKRAATALQYHCLSLRDSYWVRTSPEQCWEDLNLFSHNLSGDTARASLLGEQISVSDILKIAPDCSTDGVAPKAWVRTKDGGLYLFKGDVLGQNTVEKEVEASKILRAAGLPCVEYSYTNFADQTVSASACFTTPDIGLISFADYSCVHDSDLSGFEVEFNTMILEDYLVGNLDRHWGNFGFLFSPADGKLISFAPIMDFNHAFEAKEDDRCQPYLAAFNEITSQKEAALRAICSLQIDLQILMENIRMVDSPYLPFVQQRIEDLADFEQAKTRILWDDIDR